MQRISAGELKKNIEHALERAQATSVLVEGDQSSAILISVLAYTRFMALDDAYWMKRVKAAKKQGGIGPDAVETFCKEMPNLCVD